MAGDRQPKDLLLSSGGDRLEGFGSIHPPKYRRSRSIVPAEWPPAGSPHAHLADQSAVLLQRDDSSSAGG